MFSFSFLLFCIVVLVRRFERVFVDVAVVVREEVLALKNRSRPDCALNRGDAALVCETNVMSSYSLCSTYRYKYILKL